MRDLEGRIGLALGSGAARGWAHIGVIRELLARGIRPDVVCGSSIGAVVGAADACGRLDALESWGRQLDRRQVVSFLDVSLREGVIRALRVTEAFASHVPDRPIQGLKRAYAATATDLKTGRRGPQQR